jgi:hypothetical protein
MECGQASGEQGTCSKGGMELVSFGTNMTTEEQESDSGNVEQIGGKLDTVVARFHARKFGTVDKKATDKRPGLKVQGAGYTKK